MRKLCDFGWTEDLEDGLVLGFCRLTSDIQSLAVFRQFRDIRAVEDVNLIWEWMPRMARVFRKEFSRLGNEFVKTGNFRFVRKQMPPGPTADPSEPNKSSMAWVCPVKEKEGVGECQKVQVNT